MSPDLRIDWDDVCSNPKDFEKLVKMLLQRLHPEGRPIDGSGGDEGREFEVRTSERLELFEAKSFRGRISRRNPNRRRQVEDSLRSAAQHQPDAWHLIVAIDPNPEERRWFDSLRAGDYPFVGEWHGETWLEEKLSRYPDLVRYATENKLLAYVRTFKLEQEALVNGSADLIARYAAIDRLRDQVNPHWRPTVQKLPDGTYCASVEAKHENAAVEAPIEFTLGIAIPPGSEHDNLRERWRTHLDLGTDVEVTREFITEFKATGPAGLGLPTGERIPDLVRLIAIPETDVGLLPKQTIEIYEPTATRPIASLQFTTETATPGPKGARFVAYDPARTVKLTTDVRDNSVKITLQALDARPVTPGELVPSTRFSRAVVPPNRVVLVLSHAGNQARQEVPIDRPFLTDPPSPELVQFIEDLAVLQNALGTSFPLPDTFTAQDCANAARLRRLLDDSSVPWLKGPLRIHITPGKVDDFRAQFSNTSRGWLRISYDDIEVDFGDSTVHTGPVWMLGEMSVDIDTIAYDADGGSPSVLFDVLGDGWLHAHFGPPPDERDPDASETPAGSGRVAVKPEDTEIR